MSEYFAFEESSQIIPRPVEFAWVPRTPFLSFVEPLVKKDIRDIYVHCTVLQRETQMGIKNVSKNGNTELSSNGSQYSQSAHKTMKQKLDSFKHNSQLSIQIYNLSKLHYGSSELVSITQNMDRQWLSVIVTIFYLRFTSLFFAYFSNFHLFFTNFMSFSLLLVNFLPFLL